MPLCMCLESFKNIFEYEKRVLQYHDSQHAKDVEECAISFKALSHITFCRSTPLFGKFSYQENYNESFLCYASTQRWRIRLMHIIVNVC